MPPQSDAARLLYTQLLEEALAHELSLAQSPGKGAVHQKTIKGQTYLYWQFQDITGKVRQSYLGPARGAGADLAQKLAAETRDSRQIIASLEQKTAAFLALGGMANLRDHFGVVQALAREGLFHQGAVLVGTHAFVCLGNMLGHCWLGRGALTQDIDFARPQGVSVGVTPDLRLDVPATLRGLGMGFFEIPGLDLRQPSTSLQTRRGVVKVDFLTTPRGRNNLVPVRFRDMNFAAQPLRFMDYLLGGSPQRAVFVGPFGLAVSVPDPGRFALHKIVVSQERAAAFALKAQKDLVQAAQLAQALRWQLPGSVTLALKAAVATPGMAKRLKPGLACMTQFDEETARWLGQELAAALKEKRP